MSTGEPEAKRDELRPRERRRLKLIESYGAFSDDRLQEVAQKIRGITSDNDTQPTALQGDAPLSSGENTRSITESITQCPSGETEAVKEKQGFENTELTSANPHIVPPVASPGGSPNESPDTPDGSSNESPDTPDGSSNESPGRSPHESSNEPPGGSSNRSPDGSPGGSPNESSLQLQLPPPSSADAGILLTESQAMLYFCLKEINGKVTSLPQIARETHISEYTLKSCLKKLRQEGLIRYDGRRNCGGRIGFTATVLPHKIMLQGNKNRLLKKLQQITQQALVFTESLEATEGPAAAQTEANHLMDRPMDHLMAHPMAHPVNHLVDHPISCSSSKKLLQGVSFDAVFADLNPRSLLPYLDRFETSEELQNFLDMANACVSAAKEGKGKPIQNPHGFLFAQLRAGYINPPEGFKSRKVQAQEIRNQQLEEELATIRHLKERERELQFELFVARLSEAEMARLEQEAQAQVKSNIGLSPEFQLERYKEGLLRQWFAQRQQPQQEHGSTLGSVLDNTQ
jgi:predicted DNA-binding transcriptional regulator